MLASRPLVLLALWLCAVLAAPGALAQSADSVAVPAPQATETPPPAPEPPTEATPQAEEAAPPQEAVPAPAPSAVDSAIVAELARLRRQMDQIDARADSNRAQIAAGRTTTVEQAAKKLDEAGDALRFVGLRVVVAIVLGFLFYGLVRLAVMLLEGLAARNASRRLFYKKLLPIVRLTIWATLVYLIVGVVFEVSADGLVAAGAAVGVAIGFAAQDVLKNIFGGLIIIFDQPFQVGDKVAIGDTYGEVTAIGIRSTRIVTPDDNLVSVPNSQIVDGQVSNANAGALDCQVVTSLFLHGWVDAAKAKRIAYEAAANSKYVYLDKPIVVICKDEFKETFLLHIKVKAYVLDHKYENLLVSDVTEAAKSEFIRQGLLIPREPHHFDATEDD
jgi:small-conductance mechanosensitive channel